MVLGIISPQNYFCASFMQSALSSFVLFCLTIWTWYLSTNLAFPHHFTTQAKQRTSLHEPYPKWFKVPLTYNYLIELIVIVRDIYKAHLSKQVLGYCDMGPRDSHLTITFFFSFFFSFFFLHVMQEGREKIRTSDLRFMRRDLQPIELPFEDPSHNYLDIEISILCPIWQYLKFSKKYIFIAMRCF